MINVYCEKCNKVTEHKAVVDIINDDIPVMFMCLDCEAQKYSQYKLKFEEHEINEDRKSIKNSKNGKSKNDYYERRRH